MIILIHGNALVSISQKISQLKKGYNPLSVSELSVKSLGWGQVILDLSNSSLFDEKRLVILEQIDVSSEIDDLPDSPNLTVVLKFTKSLPSTSKILKSAILKKAQIILLSERDEVAIFPFLDGLAEKKTNVLQDLDEILVEAGGQYLLTMIFYMFRRLIVSPKSLPPFVFKKIENQKRNFPQDKITYFYKRGLETDFKIKSGLISEKLALTLLAQEICGT